MLCHTCTTAYYPPQSSKLHVNRCLLHLEDLAMLLFVMHAQHRTITSSCKGCLSCHHQSHQHQRQTILVLQQPQTSWRLVLPNCETCLELPACTRIYALSPESPCTCWTCQTTKYHLAGGCSDKQHHMPWCHLTISHGPCYRAEVNVSASVLSKISQ